MTQLLAIDQSVRGFAWATAPVFWAGDWRLVHTGRLDGGKLPRGATEAQLGARQDALIRFADRAICEHNPEHVGFESYAYSARPNTEVVEVVGSIKRMLRQWQKSYETVQQSSWRHKLCGKVKRGTEKETVKAVLIEAGALNNLSEDEYDALGILNLMIVTRGGQPFACP